MKMKYTLDRKVRLSFGFGLSTLLLMGALSRCCEVIPDKSDRSAQKRSSDLESPGNLNLIVAGIDCASSGCVFAGKESAPGNYRSSAVRSEWVEAAVCSLKAIGPAQIGYFQVIQTLIDFFSEVL